MPDNTKEATMSHIKNSVSADLNHIVRHQSGTKGIINIEANTDGSFDVAIHKGTQSKPKRIENINKTKLIEMMQDQL